MVHHGDAGGVEFPRELPDTDAGSRAQEVEDAPPRGVAQRVEHLSHIAEAGGRGLVTGGRAAGHM